MLPAHDALVFKKSLNYLVPRSAAARWKKRALSYAPWTTLQRHLPKCYVEGANTTHPHLPRLIMPWNQGPAEKLTWIEGEEKQTVVRKAALSERSRKLIRQEKRTLAQLANTELPNGIGVPEVLDYTRRPGFDLLTTRYYSGKPVKRVPFKVLAFFTELHSGEMIPLREHPYVEDALAQLYFKLRSLGFEKLIKDCSNAAMFFRSRELPVGFQHGDFTVSNLIKTHAGHYVILDWEDAVSNSLPVDTAYFKLRQVIDGRKKLSIVGVWDFLAVLHYFHFQTKKGNYTQIRRVADQIEWRYC